MKKFILLVMMLPGLVQAQVFRCESRGETYFSQIPCADDSEAVLIEDRMMFSEAAPQTKPAEKEPEAPVAPVKTQAQNMQEFVLTLQRQRTEQLQQIDRDIGALESKLNALGDDKENSPERQRLAQQLTEMQSARGSIVEQYQTMILEAERRVVALSSESGEKDGKVN